jgi:hypothetical protein
VIGRLTSRRERFDAIRGQEGQRQKAADVAIADPFDRGELSEATDLARDQRLETAMSPPDLLQQDRGGQIAP